MVLETKHSISVVFPVFNEEGCIESTICQTKQCLENLASDWEIICVNDGSHDRSGEIIEEIIKQDDRIKIVQHAVNIGYGAALKSGLYKATKELVFFCDSDLQFHLNELIIHLVWIEQFDVVIGYRAKRQDPLHRKMNAFGWNMLVRLLLELKVRDIDCAFKLFKRHIFDRISINAVGAMVNTEILTQVTRMGFKIKEVPVTHFPRPVGTQTGANIRVIIKAFKELIQLRKKLKDVRPIIFDHDLRQNNNPAHPDIEQRQKDRRKVLLPINYPDRRQRIILPHRSHR